MKIHVNLKDVLGKKRNLYEGDQINSINEKPKENLAFYFSNCINPYN